ncbi:MAG: hypothetical protein V3T77_03895, partial [Planctomycetota bacterium]
LVAACTIPLPNLGELYDRPAMFDSPERNPVIVIPGILGSKLMEKNTHRVVWGAFAGNYARPSQPDGARLIALPMKKGAALKQLRDDVVVDGALDRVRVSLFGLPFELKAYLNILGALGVGGYRDQQLSEAGAIDYGDEHFTCFQFAFDWRRDLVENAQLLHDYILDRRKYVADEYQKRFGKRKAEKDIRFDIVAHSMGGLVTRYLLRYGAAELPADGSTPRVTWAGSALVEKAVLVGTPNGGSAETLLQLVEGFQPGPFLPHYSPAILGTMPAIYQLLPRGRHGPLVKGESPPERIEDLLSAQLWQQHGWGLADPAQDAVLKVLLPDVSDRQERRAIALDHQKKCLERAAQFHAAIDTPAQTPKGLSLILFAGDAVPTSAVLHLDPKKRSLRVVERGPGDGTVLRSSALMDERVGQVWAPKLKSPISWRAVHLLFKDHIGLTKDPGFTDNVLYILLEEPP